MIRTRPFIKQDNSVLISRKSRLDGLFQLAGLSLILLAWFGGLFIAIRQTGGFSENPLDHWTLLVFSIAALPFVPQIGRALRTIRTGDALVFDPRLNVFDNGENQWTPAIVAHVQIRVRSEPDGTEEHQLYLMLKNGEWRWVESSHDYDMIQAAARRIGEIARVRVEGAPRPPG